MKGGGVMAIGGGLFLSAPVSGPINPRPGVERFELDCPFEPTGDQPAAIAGLAGGLGAGATGAGCLGFHNLPLGKNPPRFA